MNQNLSTTDTINIKKLVDVLLKHIHYFIIAFIVFIGLAVAIIKLAIPVYKIRASIIVNEKNYNISSENFFGGLDAFGFIRNNIDDEIGVLRSPALIHKTLAELNLEVSYFGKKYFIARQIQNTPYIVKIDTSAPQLIGQKIYITRLSGTKYLLETDVSRGIVQYVNTDLKKPVYDGAVNLSDTLTIGKKYVNRFFSFTLFNNPSFKPEEDEEDISYYFVVNNLPVLANDYLEKMTVSTSTLESSIVEISLDGSLIKQEKDFLNLLCQKSIEWELSNKNAIAINTIRYIDEQIGEFSDSLSSTEDKLEKFRTKDKLMDLDFQARNTYELLQKLEQEKVDLKVKHKYYTYLQEYISSNAELNKLVAPSTIGINDPLLNDLISEINALNTEKIALGYSVKSKSPTYSVLDLKMENSKKTLAENIKSILISSDIALKENDERIREATRLVNKLPKTERELINIQRKFNHNDLIFNFLMEKKAAANIAKASNVSDSSVLNPATVITNDPVFPNKLLVALLALVLSFIFPVGLILSKEFFRKKIHDKNDVLSLTKLLLAGIIPHSREARSFNISEPVLKEYLNITRNTIGKYFTKEHTVIGISSPSGKEGKTFVSTQLALAFTRAGKKVLLLEASFRNPSLAAYSGLTVKNTLNDYLENETDIDKIIYASSKEGYDMIFAQHTEKQDELIHSFKFRNMFCMLREKYELIIIDGTSTAHFSDYYSIAEFTDINLFVVRNNRSTLKDLERLNEHAAQEVFQPAYVILNDYMLSKKIANKIKQS